MITGPHTANFAAAVGEFSLRNALLRLDNVTPETAATQLADAFKAFLANEELRESFGKNALAVMKQNRGAADRTLEFLGPLLGGS